MRQGEAFQFGPYSHKQAQAVTWWRQGSPVRDMDGIITDGAIRSGKTIADIDGFLEWTRASFRDQAFIVSSKSIGALKRNVLRPMLHILNAKVVPYHLNRSENFIEVGRNTFFLFGANNEASQDVLQGLTAAGWLGDEAALQPQSFIEQAIARCSVDGSRYWLNCNPESPNHFVKKELIDQAHEKRLLRLHFTMDDNLTLPESIKERYRRMYSGVWYKRFILGQWVAADGAIFDMLDEDLHVVAEHTLPQIFEYFVGCDYGTASVTTFWLLGRGERELFFVDFWRHDAREKGRQKTDAEMADDLDSWLMRLNINPRQIFIPDDASSFALAVQKLRQRKEARGERTAIGPVAFADRSPGSVLEGIRDLSTLFYLGILKFSKRVVDAGGLVEWQGYVWDEKAQKLGEDKPVKVNDHGPDAGRYVCRGVRYIWQPWLERVVS